MSQRPLFFLLILVSGALAAGCGAEGSYRLEWTFADVPAVEGCGAHGVDGVHVTGGNTEGDSENIVAVCSDGQMVRKLPVGRWNLVVHQLDARGVAINVADQAIPDVVISEDALTEGLPVVVLEARPQCADGVDNDRDGRVDLDDLECGGDPLGGTE